MVGHELAEGAEDGVGNEELHPPAWCFYTLCIVANIALNARGAAGESDKEPTMWIGLIPIRVEKL
jgi:hypothetical protein